MQICKYCEKRLNDNFLARTHLLEAILCVFDPEQTDAWIGNNILYQLENRLKFDNDGLLIGPRNHIVFKKEGVLTPKFFVLYNRLLPGIGLSGGFLEDLLKFVETLSSPPNLGFAVDHDAVLGREYYSECNTRAYIRGPKGISEETLQKDSFPENHSGTVTTHERVCDDPISALFPLKKTEIMWSRRNNIKTVQIEELRDRSIINHSHTEKIWNHYVHARWDIDKRAFIHFDGAVRGYEREFYDERLHSDIKKFQGKPSYKKLFRIDTEIDLDTWCKLVVKFYCQNKLVLEYLGGPEPDPDS